MKRLWLCLFSTLLAVAGCAAPSSWTRTTDHFDTETRTYYNESMQLKVSFPDGWKIVTKPGASRYSWTYKAERDAGVELAMIAEHPKRLAYVSILIAEANLKGKVSSPKEYVEYVKQLNYKHFKASREVILDERVLKDVLVADWEYELPWPSENAVTYRELVFFKDGFACRIRFHSKFYFLVQSTCEEIMQSISISY